MLLFYYIGDVDKTTTLYFCIVLTQPQIVLNMFLFLTTFQPQCSYKIVLIKKKECINTTFNVLIKPALIAKLIMSLLIKLY